MILKFLTVASFVILAGCTTQMTKGVEGKVNEADRKASQLMDSLKSGQPSQGKAERSTVRRVEQAWVPVAKLDENARQRAEVANRHVSVNRKFNDLSDAAAYITSLTGVPVSVTANARKTADDLTQKSLTSQRGLPGVMQPGVALPPLPMGMQNGAGTTSQMALNSAHYAPISYSGNLSGFMDILAARYGLFWEPDSNNGITLFKTKTQSFRLAALPGDSSMSSIVGTQSTSSGSGGGGGSAGGAAGGAQSVSTSSASAEQRSGIKFDGLSVWKGIEESLKAMLSIEGKVVVTPATGTVTVDDTPPVLEKVAAFIKDQNSALKRQVLLNVRVLTVELNDSDSYGINWDMVYKNISTGAGVALQSVSGLAAGNSSLAFNIVRTNGLWDGTKVMLEALSKQGRVSQVTSASIVTINNQPAPLQVGRQRSYLASSTTTIGTAGSGNTTTLQPGVISTGFSMSVLPHILDSEKLMLQYSADISALVGIATVTSGQSSIQTPEVDTRNFLQRVLMNNGETLVLTGFEQFGANGGKQGIGSPDNVLLGGSVSGSQSKNMIVVLIQPVMSSVN
ncbi:PilN family type IVB pilus formation outer membrane protein [Diaphorobacter sp. LR2014-1]|uniref:PilN family type IVB pilus formation outer membrane protein n=1 Tax=Diaphorobacter sp. LR2014-1 TaxID=1933219 RepID=UPI000CDB779C|nr:PilN family type IVB pilus formation outer membrane protein [Diaphorobacter sp. LR2014-1]POR10871.1 type IVB pilus formation outer membrane protein, R64 PilN family [Diaphorobacter sp. LR2014-1]